MEKCFNSATLPHFSKERERRKKVLISGLHERKTFSIHKIMNISWWYQHLFILMLELMSFSRCVSVGCERVYYILHIVYGRPCSLLLFNSSFSISFYLLYAFCLSISLFDGVAKRWWWCNVCECVWLKWKMSFIFSRAVKSYKMKTKYTFVFRCLASETCKIGRARNAVCCCCWFSVVFSVNTQTFWALPFHSFSRSISLPAPSPSCQPVAFISIYHRLDIYSHELARIRMLWFHFYQHFTFSKFCIFLWICFVLEIVSTELCVSFPVVVVMCSKIHRSA